MAPSRGRSRGRWRCGPRSGPCPNAACARRNRRKGGAACCPRNRRRGAGPAGLPGAHHVGGLVHVEDLHHQGEPAREQAHRHEEGEEEDRLPSEARHGRCGRIPGDSRRLVRKKRADIHKSTRIDSRPRRAAMLLRSAPPPAKEVDLTRTYDAVVVGSGAAGGMAAHVLTAHGLDVLLLEAGKKLDIEAELKSMEWPYDHPRRGRDALRPRTRCRCNEYNVRQPPYARGHAPAKTVHSYVQSWSGPTTARTSWWTRRSTPTRARTTPGCARACLGGKTNIWGRLALRLSDYDFKAKSHDGYGEDWPISYADIEPYYDKVDLLPRHLRPPRRASTTCPTASSSGPPRLNAAEVTLRRVAGDSAAACSRRTGPASPPTALQAQQVPQPLLRPGRLQPPRGRLRHPRRLRLAHRPHLPGHGHRPADAAHRLDRARGHGRSRPRARRAASPSSTPRPARRYEAQGPGR